MVIRFQARPRLPVCLPTAVEVGHVTVTVNDWDFLERLATNNSWRTPVSAYGCFTQFSGANAALSLGLGARLLSEFCCLSLSAVPNNRPSLAEALHGRGGGK